MSFQELVSAEQMKVLEQLGYEAATPVQKESIPLMRAGHDVLVQAQTGTGKTGAFALPILEQIDIKLKKPQALIMAPTRELAIQVAEAFQSYAKHMPEFRVTPIYGGQDYRVQLRALDRGVHVIVATPGRVMDHMRRGSISLDALKAVVLDEADEMLKMGFVEDITWILEQVKQPHQTACFSATMPAPIKKISARYMKDAKIVNIEPKKKTMDTIDQCCLLVSKKQKLEVLTRLLEVEDVQAALIFVRTKTASAELAERLQARGHAVAALNGDMNQNMREKVIARLKKGSLDIVVATDVAARGIDVERISHVVNFDVPYDAESYIHRIGRTGRAGRSGRALLFISGREKSLLADIERAIDQKIPQIQPPSIKEMSEKRGQQLADKVISILAKSKRLVPSYEMVELIKEQGGCSAEDVAAALIYMTQQDKPLPVNEIEAMADDESSSRRSSRNFRGGRRREGSGERSGFKGRSGSGDGRRDSRNGSGDSRRKSYSSGSRDDSSEGSDRRKRSYSDRPRRDSSEYSGDRKRSYSDRSRDESAERSGNRKRSYSDGPRGGSSERSGDRKRSYSDGPRGGSSERSGDRKRSYSDGPRGGSSERSGDRKRSYSDGPRGGSSERSGDRKRSYSDGPRGGSSDRKRSYSDGPKRTFTKKSSHSRDKV